MTSVAMVNPLFPAKWGGTFLCLLMVSVMKPSTLLGIQPLPLAPVLLILMTIVLIWQMHRTMGVRQCICRYWFESVLVVLYVLVCLYSLMLNRDSQYPNDYEFLHLGIVPIAIWLTFPMMLLLFSLPQPHSEKKEQSLAMLVWAVFASIALLGIWQAVDYEGAMVLTKHTVASELALPHNVSSVFRISTDLGPIMAFCILTLLCNWRNSLLAGSKLETKVIALLVIMLSLFLTAGIASGSRNFMLGLLTGSMALAIFYLRRYPKWVLLGTISFIVIFHILALSNDQVFKKYGTILPYLHKIHDEQAIYIQDFVPVINNASLTLRFEIWERALKFIQTNWEWGISNGGFKRRNLSEWGTYLGNTHNYFLQALVDSGVYGLSLCLTLHLWLIRKVKNGTLPLLFAVIATSMFDHYIDHSLPWILCVSWLLMNVNNVPQSNNDDSKVLLYSGVLDQVRTKNQV